MKLKYGDGHEPEDFDAWLQGLIDEMQSRANVYCGHVLNDLERHAPMIAKCSKAQYKEAKRALSLGRVRSIGNILDKVQCYGAGRMAKHIVRNEGITADTFLGLTKQEREQLTDGVVLVKDRNDILRIRAAKLTAAQMRKVVLSHVAEGGPRILAPEEQCLNRPRRDPSYYVPESFMLDGKTVVVTCVLHERRFRARFSRSDLAKLKKVFG